MGFKFPKINAKALGTAVGVGAIGGIGTAAYNYYNSTKKDKPEDDGRKAEDAAMVAEYDAARAADRNKLAQIAGTTTPGVTAAAIDPMWRQKQADLVATLQAQASGQGPSLAQQQFKQSSNTALQKTMGAIRAGTGSNAALSARTAALAGTNLLGQAASESGMARLKEQQDAQSALANALAAGRTADMQQRAQDIQLGQANADAAIRQQQISADIYKSMLGETSGRYEGGYNRSAQVQVANAKGNGQQGSIIPAVIGAGGAIIGGIYGGPAGAVAGGTAGKAVGDAAASQGGTSLALTQKTPTGTMGGRFDRAEAANDPIPARKVRANPFGRVIR